MNDFSGTSKYLLIGLFILMCYSATCQEIYFFSEGTAPTFYDQGIVDVANLGASTFEHTFPPGFPQYDDKVPCSGIAFKGATSLKFNYTSAENGNWQATIFRNDWSAVDLTGMDSLAFYIYSENGLPASALPLIGLRTIQQNQTSTEGSSKLFKLADYNEPVPENKWTRLKFPLRVIFDDAENNALDFSKVKGIIFSQSENNGISRLWLLDELAAYKSLGLVPQVENLAATGYDSHVALNWEQPIDGLSYRVYASFDDGQAFELRGETQKNFYFDFVSENERNSAINYRVVAVSQETESEPKEAAASVRDFADDELLDMVQRQTFRYFWEGAHTATGMALERSNGDPATAASGATGMGLMAMIVAHEREYRPKEEVKSRILMILDFFKNCERHHGAWSHWYNAGTGKTQPFSPDDDGGDLVETSYVAQALIALKNYFSGADEKSIQIREKADQLWKEIDWSWYRNGGQNVLYWHWSPTVGFQKNMKITGWNESLITYLMAASSPTYPITKEVYEQGWAKNGGMVEPRTFYNNQISLSPDWGGTLFWIHYSFLGINPHGLKDQYADYWQENVNNAQIHHAYAIDNPQNHKNYSDKNWGLTASDDPTGYTAHRPVTNDNGTISPTAALASMPYAPEASVKALKYFYRERGSELFGPFGFYDAFNDDLDWVAESYLGIDQAPIIDMIENHRTGLLWNSVMRDPDVQAGLGKLGFQYEVVTNSGDMAKNGLFKLYPNPCRGMAYVWFPEINDNKQAILKLFSADGRLLLTKNMVLSGRELSFDCHRIKNGLYLIQINAGKNLMTAKLLIQKQE